MIHGMEVLKKTEITTMQLAKNGWIPLILGLTVAVLFIVLAIIVARIEIRDWCKIETWWPTVLSFAAIVPLIAGFHFYTKAYVEVPTGRYEYEVLISDASTMKEVYEQYEVVGSKGEIYIVRDREVADNVCSGCKSKIKDDNKFCPECGAKQ